MTGKRTLIATVLAVSASVSLVGGQALAQATAKPPTTAPAPVTTPPPSTVTPSGLSYQQIPLTDAMVQTFIKTYPTVKPKIDAVAAKYKIVRNGKAIDGGFSAFLAATPAAAAEFNGAVTPSGYADFQTWLNTTMSVLFATEWAVGGPQMDAYLAQIQGVAAAAASSNSAAVNSPQAAQALAQAQSLGINVTGTLATAGQAAQSLGGSLAAMRPSDANIKVVAPYAKQLQPMLKP